MAEQDSKYEVRHQIGRGSFGSAFLVTNKQDKAEYVLKRVRLAKQTPWQRNSTLQERKLATSLRHPFIVPCVESWVVQNHTVNMIYAFCQNGDLSSYLSKVKKQDGQVEEVLMAKWLCQLLLALDYLQTQQVLHRDIKTSNLMLTAEDDVQLGDFGLATMMKEEGDESKPQDDNLVGTPHYMSPELLSCKGYGFKTDVWSLGCVLYELTAQRPTFNAFNIHGLVSKIKKNKLAPLPASYSPEWRDVIALMLCKNPEKRPSVQQLMALPALRPAMLEARARARELMPSVPLPPLLDPTPLTPLPLLGAGYRSSCSQDVADAESEGSGGGSASDQQQGGGRCSGGGGGGSEAGSSSKPSGRGERRSAGGLAAAQAVQASELSELWKANFARVQQQEEQLDTERPEQQSAADTQHCGHHQQQQDDELVRQPSRTALGSEQGSRGGAGTAGGGSVAGSVHAGSSSAGGHSSSSSRVTTPGQLGAEAGRGTGVAVGYSPRNGLGVIDGYRRMMTPPRPGQAVHQPGIKRTPSERVAAAIAAAGGSPGQATTAAAAAAAVKATGRVTPDLCPRPSVPARVPRSSSSTSRHTATPAAVTPQHEPPGSAGSTTPGAQPSPAGSAAVTPRMPSSSSIAKWSTPMTTPRQDSSSTRRYRASDCTHVHGSGASTARPGCTEDASLPTARAAAPGAAAAAATPPRPLSAPRSSSVRRASDRGPQGSGGGGSKQQQQRPPWGAGAGGRSGLTPSRQRPEQSPIFKAANSKVAYADSSTAAAGATGLQTPGTAGILADAAAAAAGASRQRRAHGQLSPVPSETLPPATGREAVVEGGAPSDARQQHQAPQQADCSSSSRSGRSSTAGSGAEAPPTHGLSRTGSRGSSAGGRQHQEAATSETSAQATSSACSQPRHSAGGTPLPPLPLHKLQHSGSSRSNMQDPPELSPIPLASPVHGQDRQDRQEPEGRTARVSSGILRSQPRGSAAGQAEAGAGDAQQPEQQPAQSRRSLPGASSVDSSSRRVSRSASTSRRSAGSSTSSRRGNTQAPDEQQQQRQQERTPQSAAGSRSASSSMTSSSRRHQQQQGDQQAATPQPSQSEPEQQQQQQALAVMQQRLELLEAAMMVIGGLVERKRWTELASVMRSEGLLPPSVLGAAAAAAAGGQQQQQQLGASSVLKLGDIVVLGKSRSIRGKIRYTDSKQHNSKHDVSSGRSDTVTLHIETQRIKRSCKTKLPRGPQLQRAHGSPQQQEQ